ncbi:MAG: hypothetical protein ACTSRZ_08730 [Promethearchaeota archaeon]
MRKSFWYLYATDHYLYTTPSLRFIIGIIKPRTANLLMKEEIFFLMPKDAKRHQPNIYKHSIQEFFGTHDYIKQIETSNGVINEYRISCVGTIYKKYDIDINEESDLRFIKLITPFYPWTLKHVVDYISGAKFYQEGNIVGKSCVIILRVFKLKKSFSLYHLPKPRVSNQVLYFNIEESVEFMLENKEYIPIIKEEEFNALIELIQFIRDNC